MALKLKPLSTRNLMIFLTPDASIIKALYGYPQSDGVVSQRRGTCMSGKLAVW